MATGPCANVTLCVYVLAVLFQMGYFESLSRMTTNLLFFVLFFFNFAVVWQQVSI